MANRMVENVYIIDVGSANTALPWNAGSRIQTVSFWSTDTTGRMELSGSNTTNVVAKLENPFHFEATVSQHLGGIRFSEMKVPILTAGTGFIYFS